MPTPDRRPTSRSARAPAAPSGVLRDAARSRTFWLLSGGFAICGMTTNGLIATHFVPAAHDHGMPATTAASLLAVVGIFDVVGTIASGWLTDKVDPRLLLVGYYVLRGVGLMTLPALMSPHVAPSMWVFIIIYGLDWVATVPPTVALCREHFGAGVGPDRLRLGVRQPPGRRCGGGDRRGRHPGPHRRLRPGVLRRGRALRGGRR